MKGLCLSNYIFMLLCIGMGACKEDEPQPVELTQGDSYILFRGVITDAETGDPIPDLTIFANVGRRGQFFWEITTDSTGSYLIDVPSIHDALREEGFNEREIFDFFALEEFDVGFNIYSRFCEWISTDPSFSTEEYYVDYELPINYQKNFSLNRSTEFQVILIDTVGREPGTTGWRATLEFRDMEKDEGFSSLFFYDMENFPFAPITQCLPFNQSVEMKATFSEFIRDINETPLGSKTFMDTLYLTGTEIGQYVLPW